MIKFNKYLQEIFNFLRTMTIKNEWFAIQSKRSYATRNGLDINSVTDFENPYYLNICGIRAFDDTSDPIYIPKTIAEDTELTLDLILNNISIRESLRLPNSNFKKICEAYPLKVGLIKSIVYPIMVDIDDDVEDLVDTCPATIRTLLGESNVRRVAKVIQAPHLTLLQYDTSILEELERDSILQAVNNALIYFKTRWSVKEFTSETFFPAVSLAILIHYLHITIQAARIRNINPPIVNGVENGIVEQINMPVHSYHVNEYLNSRGLADYGDILSATKARFLYNNLRYILANKGKKSIIKLLSDHLLEPEGVELFGKMMLTNTDQTSVTCKKQPEFISIGVGGDSTPSQYFSGKAESLPEMLNREKESGLEPIDERPSIVREQTYKLSTSKHTRIRTPLMEFSKPSRYGGLQDLYMRFFFSTFLHEWNTGRLANLASQLDMSYYSTMTYLNPTDTVYLANYVASKIVGLPIDDNTLLPEIFHCGYAIKTSSSYIDDNNVPGTISDLSINDIVTTFDFPTIDEIVNIDISDYIDIENVCTPLLREAFEHVIDDPVLDHKYRTLGDLKLEIDRRFGYLSDFLMESRTTTEMFARQSAIRLYKQLFATYTFKHEPENNLVTYGNWFSINESLKDIVTFHENVVSGSATWTNLFSAIMRGPVPLINNPWVNYNWLSDYEYTKMAELFMQLCSYNIAFLKPSSNTGTWGATGHISYRNSDPTQVGNYRIPISVRVSLSKYSPSSVIQSSRMVLVSPITSKKVSSTISAGSTDHDIEDDTVLAPMIEATDATINSQSYPVDIHVQE